MRVESSRQGELE